MRGCLSVLVLAAAFTIGVAWFAGPAVAGFAITSALEASGFEAGASTVTVAADPPIEILAGHADEVAIAATDVRFETVDAATITLSLADVDLVQRRFGTVSGVLTGVLVRQGTSVVPVRRIELSGPESGADTVLTLDASVVEGRAAAAINERLGVPIAGARLTGSDGLFFSIGAVGVTARLVADADGSLVLAVPVPGNPRVVLVDGDAIQFDSATVDDGSLVLRGTIDLGGFIR